MPAAAAAAAAFRVKSRVLVQPSSSPRLSEVTYVPSLSPDFCVIAEPTWHRKYHRGLMQGGLLVETYHSPSV
ncbi:hypothetical protein E2C01_070165 [Portunus trituberculatus]|uniref:Uncharacterized protein n=1 Tax=Portunus trituberculatus TaxID=210409 RepID=A0A5B7HTG5_PORTR|nr:hypothetical protein [Portunus trituberculatus]